MRQRGIIILIAVFFGIIAAFMVTNYANRAKNKALQQTKMVKVMVAADTLPVGLTLNELKQQGLVTTKNIPKDFVAEGAMTPQSRMGDKVLSVSLNKGEQLTSGRFKLSKKAGLSFAVPEDKVAVAVPIDDMKATGNLIKIGDFVNVIGSAKQEGAQTQYITKTILQKVQVLAIGSNLENINPEQQQQRRGALGSSSRQSTSAGKTITLALSQADAEKLVFIQDQGVLWFTLLPSGQAETTTTGGQTIDTVFR